MSDWMPDLPGRLFGTDEIQPPDAKVPKLRKRDDYDRPADQARALCNRGAEHLAWRSMMDEVMFEIREITGQEYVNYYARRTKPEAPACRHDHRRSRKRSGLGRQTETRRLSR